jgi:hypothetical protein
MNVADKGNEVLSLDVVDHSDKKGELLVVTENGYGKRTNLTEYPVKGRGAKGVLTAKLTAKKGGLAGARVVREGQELIFISQSGMVQRNAVEGISRMGRPTQGVRLMNLKKGDRVSAVALVVESTETNGNGAAATAAPVEDEAPTTESVADEAAAAEAAGNGEAKVTKRSGSTATAPKAKPKPASKGKARVTKAKPKPAAKPKSKAPSAKPKAKPKPAPKKRSSSASAPAAKAKSARPKVKPKHTATAKQRAESAAKKRK